MSDNTNNNNNNNESISVLAVDEKELTVIQQLVQKLAAIEREDVAGLILRETGYNILNALGVMRLAHKLERGLGLVPQQVRRFTSATPNQDFPSLLDREEQLMWINTDGPMRGVVRSLLRRVSIARQEAAKLKEHTRKKVQLVIPDGGIEVEFDINLSVFVYQSTIDGRVVVELETHDNTPGHPKGYGVQYDAKGVPQMKIMLNEAVISNDGGEEEKDG
jgi:hypothetical protein